MRSLMLAALWLGMAAPAVADAMPPAGQPAFDPRTLRGTQEGPLTQVLTLGSTHLRGMEHGPTPAELDALLDRLEAFHPAIITHEGLSGEQCDQLERYKSRYPGVYDDYCWGTAEAQRSTGLTVPQALEQIETTLATWPAAPTAAQRRRLSATFLAANDRPSALVQWLQLAPQDRTVGDGIDQPLFAILDEGSRNTNETIAIGVALAVRLGLQRIYAVDDHTADNISSSAGAGYQAAIEASWARSDVTRFPGVVRAKAAEEAVATSRDFLAYYRVLNEPATLRDFITFDFGEALRLKGSELYGRQYVAWFEARNLRMAANIRAAFGNHPGARVLNIVGASHKGYYDAYLDMMSDVQIVDAEAVLR